MRRLWARKGSRGIWVFPIPFSDLFPPQARARPLRPSFPVQGSGRSVHCLFGPLLLPLGAHIRGISRSHRLRQSITVKRVYGKLRRRSCRDRRNTFAGSRGLDPCPSVAPGAPQLRPPGTHGGSLVFCAAAVRLRTFRSKPARAFGSVPPAPSHAPFSSTYPQFSSILPSRKIQFLPVVACTGKEAVHEKSGGTAKGPVPDGFDTRIPSRRGRSDAFPQPLPQRGDFRNHGPCENPDQDGSRAHEPRGTQSPIGSSGCHSVKTTEQDSSNPKGPGRP